MTSTISILVAARNSVVARQAIIHDRPGDDPENSMQASRLCSRQTEGIDTAILLEPPADVSDLRLIVLAAMRRLAVLEMELDAIEGGRLLPLVEHLTIAMEHIAVDPAIGDVDDGNTDELRICRDHVATRVVSAAEGR